MTSLYWTGKKILSTAGGKLPSPSPLNNGALPRWKKIRVNTNEPAAHYARRGASIEKAMEWDAPNTRGYRKALRTIDPVYQTDEHGTEKLQSQFS
jgi:hypothetical protein